MKSKLLLLSLLVLPILFMTGCGGKKLVCTLKQERNFGGVNVKMNSEIDLGLTKDDEIDSANASFEVTLDEATYNELEKIGSANETMKYLKEQMEKSFTSTLPSDAVKLNSKISKNVISISADIDLSSAKETKTKEEAIEYYESSGYECE